MLNLDIKSQKSPHIHKVCLQSNTYTSKQCVSPLNPCCLWYQPHLTCSGVMEYMYISVSPHFFQPRFCYESSYELMQLQPLRTARLDIVISTKMPSGISYLTSILTRTTSSTSIQPKLQRAFRLCSLTTTRPLHTFPSWLCSGTLLQYIPSKDE